MLFPILCRADGYSGYCVYPGSFVQVDISKAVKVKDGYTVAARSEHSIIELYKGNSAEADISDSAPGGRVYLSSLKYVKILGISGPYLTVLFEVFDEKGSKIAQMESGKICNLKWLKEKHGTPSRYFLEKEKPKVDFAILDAPTALSSKFFFFCLSCLIAGIFTGFIVSKMIEYDGEKNT